MLKFNDFHCLFLGVPDFTVSDCKYCCWISNIHWCVGLLQVTQVYPTRMLLLSCYTHSQTCSYRMSILISGKINAFLCQPRSKICLSAWIQVLLSTLLKTSVIMITYSLVLPHLYWIIRGKVGQFRLSSWTSYYLQQYTRINLPCEWADQIELHSIGWVGQYILSGPGYAECLLYLNIPLYKTFRLSGTHSLDELDSNYSLSLLHSKCNKLTHCVYL